MNRCRRCELDVMHCHGTLVRHGDGGWECSAGDCMGEVDAHDLVLTCAELWSGCCAPDAAAGVRAGARAG